MTAIPLVSICMPMRNAAPFLRECLESIIRQSFTDFECIIVDDGSTDNSVAIAREFDDARLRIIETDHNYVAALNCAIREARGQFIARMDADDVMCPDRLQRQVDFLTSHPGVDVLCGKVAVFTERTDHIEHYSEGKTGIITLSQLAKRCEVCHPTVMMRSSSVAHLQHALYDASQVYAGDYDLWVRLLAADKIIYNSGEVYVYYRIHKAQVSQAHNASQVHHAQEIQHRALEVLKEKLEIGFQQRPPLPATSRQLTVIVPFLNEGNEVRRTIESLVEHLPSHRSAENSVEILVINDASDDGYDYAQDLAHLPIHYVVNPYRIGVAKCRDKGVTMCQTPYFLLLDAHMRFYTSNWIDEIVSALEANDRRILCCASVFLEKNDAGLVEEMEAKLPTYGAYLEWEEKSYMPGITWNYLTQGIPGAQHGDNIATQAMKTARLLPIPAILGAGYATSCHYWQQLRGLEGLVYYGCDEAYLSLKAWREGGGCYLLQSVPLGHIYRTKSPYRVHTFEFLFNHLLITETLFPTALKFHARYWAQHLAPEQFRTATEYIKINNTEIQQLRNYYRNFHGKSFADVWQMQQQSRIEWDIQHCISGKEARNILSWLRQTENHTHSIGLFNGTAGLLLTALYLVETGHREGEEWSLNLWQSLSESLRSPQLLTFRSGLSGVGWMLVFAHAHGLIENAIEKALAQIDRQLMQQSITRTEDLSFIDGVGGIYAYVVVRCAYALQSFPLTTEDSGESPFSISTVLHEHLATITRLPLSFITELHHEAKRIVRESHDWRTKSYAAQFLALGLDNDENLLPELSDIVTLPFKAPDDASLWTAQLDNALGALLQRLHHEFVAKHRI